ncbi:MAG: GNAT family N-acetyltransferase [Vicinamibacteria bacterium]|nr:GNAT family N-acetyltransferase [Vicinamibacteria bacterium]
MSVDRRRVALRRARVEDAALVFRWRNDPFILARSSSQRPVGWDEHVAWIGRTLGNPARLVLIAEVDGVPAGQVRFELLKAGEAVVSAYLVEAFTGRGLGVEAIRAGVVEAARRWGPLTVVAWVRSDNPAGRKAFERAGFGPCERPDTPAQHECLALAAAAEESFEEDDLRNAAHYDALVRQHGLTHRALDWGSAESQRRRFEVLCDGLPVRGARLLDVGCGTGDLLAFLRERAIECDYTGLDVSPAMVETAAARLPGARFLRGSVLEPPSELGDGFDCVVASGIFAHRRVQPLEFLRAAAARLYALCRRGAAFNALSAWGDRGTPGEFRADPAQTLAFCRSLTPKVALRHDYHPGDFTVYLFR